MKAVQKETKHIALGVALGDGVMLLVFALLKKLDVAVLLGTALGSAAAIWNFYYMGVSVQRAVQDADRAQATIRRSYTLRMLALVAVLIVGFTVRWFHPIAVAIPLLFPGLAIRVMGLLGLYKPKEEA